MPENQLVGKDVVRNLKQIRDATKTQIYDPEFDDPAVSSATSQLCMSLADAPRMCFVIWCLLVVFNNATNRLLSQLWNASDTSAEEAILDRASWKSITTRGNESKQALRNRFLLLKRHFKYGAGRAAAIFPVKALLSASITFQEFVAYRH
jgi:hypothetical protein